MLVMGLWCLDPGLGTARLVLDLRLLWPETTKFGLGLVASRFFARSWSCKVGPVYITGGKDRVTDYRSSVCCYPSPFWGYTLHCELIALHIIVLLALNCLCRVLYTLQAALVWGLARRGERLWCSVKFVLFDFEMFYASAILFLIAHVGTSCIPANARLTSCAHYIFISDH